MTSDPPPAVFTGIYTPSLTTCCGQSPNTNHLSQPNS